MSIHPFLQKQGIESIQPYTALADKIDRDSKDLGLKLHGYGFNMQKELPAVYASTEDAIFKLITISEERVICEVSMDEGQQNREIFTTDYLQTQYNYGLIDYIQRNKVKFDIAFNQIRTKWDIPTSHQEFRDFFKLLSCGQGAVFLPDLIRHPELIDEINSLCESLKLRPKVPAEFWIVCAYLLFGELIYTNMGELLFHCYHTIRLFKVREDSGFKLFIELYPPLQFFDWLGFFEPIQGQLKQKGFVPGDGSIGNFGDILGENIPEEHRTRLVLSIPSILTKKSLAKKSAWKDLYQSVRSVVEERYGKGYDPRDHIPTTEWEWYLISRLESRERAEEKINNSFLRVITEEISRQFPDKIFAEDDIRKYWDRYKEKRKIYYVDNFEEDCE